MADKAAVRALIERYCTAMNTGDRATWLDCFAADAYREDPVGTPPQRGHDEIGAAYDENHVPVTLSLTQDPLVVGDEVIAFLTVVAEMDGQTMTLPRIVDHIVLTDDGARFASLRAFFDYAELVPASG
jgi:steroid delta-isomerase